ncbi:MAG: DEAD/DEAH box helicase [Defluviitaleaceae bacterium]|nr:DEAD/DEAH box helicase [Defluviitaleaceae bacterium]
MSTKFNTFVGEALTQKLEAMGIVTPTDIQRRAIPIIAEKRDLIAQSPTGTGKTLAYLLPIISRINPEIRAAQAIITAPTYELAAQIAKVAAGLMDDASSVALLIGSASKPRQLEALKKKPTIIVGSIGRILDFISDKKLSVHHAKTLVFDEADKLFVEEGMDNVGRLIKSTLRERQILLFSAKIPEATRALAMPLMKDPEVLLPKSRDILPENIRHFYIVAPQREKFNILRKLVHAENMSKAIVFVNTPFTIEKAATRLNFHKLSTSPLYGAADKLRRKKALDDFRSGRARLLVASDVGARGLDIGGLDFVINLDLPDSDTGYLHRAGRCGRMGADGRAYSIITPSQISTLHKFAKKLGILIEEISL